MGFPRPYPFREISKNGKVTGEWWGRIRIVKISSSRHEMNGPEKWEWVDRGAKVRFSHLRSGNHKLVEGTDGVVEFA